MSSEETTELWIDIRLKVRPVRMTREGITFHASRSFQTGERYTFNVGGVFTVEGEVTGCEMREMDSPLMEAQYVVESRFVGQGHQGDALEFLSGSLALNLED